MRVRALPLVAAAVIAIEAAAGGMLPAKYFSHEVDRVLERIRTERFDSDVLLIGDSVGQNVFNLWDGSPGYAFLATNQAIEMAGQYYILKRYLRKNRKPHAVVYMGHNPLAGDLSQRLTENYVQRTFNDWGENLEMTILTKSPTFGLKSAAYRLFPTFKYRRHLQKDILGYDNGAAGAAGFATIGADTGARNFGLFRMIGSWLDERREDSISKHYFLRTGRLLAAENIHLYLLPAPFSQSGYESDGRPRLPGRARRIRAMIAKLEEGERTYIHLEKRMVLVYPDSDFGDGVHFIPERREAVRRDIDPFLESIRRRERPELKQAAAP